MNLADIVKTVAPALGAALPLPPPLGSLASKWLADKVLGNAALKPEEVRAALENPSPELMLKLKEQDNAFSAHMRELNVDLEKLTIGDRADARRMQSETQSVMPAALSLIATGAFLLALAIIFFVDVPAPRRELIVYMLGVLTVLVKDAYAYYMSTNANSARKDDLVKHMWDSTP